MDDRGGGSGRAIGGVDGARGNTLMGTEPFLLWVNVVIDVEDTTLRVGL